MTNPASEGVEAKSEGTDWLDEVFRRNGPCPTCGTLGMLGQIEDRAASEGVEQTARELLSSIHFLRELVRHDEPIESTMVRVGLLRELLDVAEASLSSLPCVDAWQPIETAPTDGSLILLCWPNWEQGVRISRWLKNAQRWTWDGSHDYRVTVGEPVYWQPLPKPPLSTPSKEAGR